MCAILYINMYLCKRKCTSYALPGVYSCSRMVRISGYFQGDKLGFIKDKTAGKNPILDSSYGCFLLCDAADVGCIL